MAYLFSWRREQMTKTLREPWQEMKTGCSSTGQHDQVSVDVRALTLSLKEEFKQLHQVSQERCIYRVPKRLRVLNENAYTPQCVSIGPYHHGKLELKAMEEHKTMYLQHFLRFSQVSLETFVSCVRDNEIKLRNSYQEIIYLDSERFVRMMLVDAAFVILVMLRCCYCSCSCPHFHNENELIFNKPRMINDIYLDMIMLENQLPFFILQELFVLSNLPASSDRSMINLFSCFLKHQPWIFHDIGAYHFSEPKHLVDFLRIGYKPLLQQHMHDEAKVLNAVKLPSVVELHQAGVKFKCGSSTRLLDMKFNAGVLEIPRLILTDHSEISFRNLQAFEQCDCGDALYLNNYISMINMLVKGRNDVDILTQAGIIEKWLHSSKQVIHLINSLSKENILERKDFYFTKLVYDLNKHCRQKRHKWRASLRQNYFYSPWAIISVIAATFVILLTIVQTICSILQVRQHQ